MTEAETRRHMIDARLGEASWVVTDRTQVWPEFAIELNARGNSAESKRFEEAQSPYLVSQFSDYVLLGKNGKPLAVVEAKRTSKDAEVGREQAKQYCLNIQVQNDGDLPFCFYTNGHDIYFWNLGEAPPQKVHGFPTRQDLERLLYLRTHQKPLADELINTAIAGRDYQLQAIRAVMEGIAQKRRQFLLVMATGTGKTRTCIALVDALMRAARVQRVLFLVDRIALSQSGARSVQGTYSRRASVARPRRKDHSRRSPHLRRDLQCDAQHRARRHQSALAALLRPGGHR